MDIIHCFFGFLSIGILLLQVYQDNELAKQFFQNYYHCNPSYSSQNNYSYMYVQLIKPERYFDSCYYLVISPTDHIIHQCSLGSSNCLLFLSSVIISVIYFMKIDCQLWLTGKVHLHLPWTVMDAYSLSSGGRGSVTCPGDRSSRLWLQKSWAHYCNVCVIMAGCHKCPTLIYCHSSTTNVITRIWGRGGHSFLINNKVLIFPCIVR